MGTVENSTRIPYPPVRMRIGEIHGHMAIEHGCVGTQFVPVIGFSRRSLANARTSPYNTLWLARTGNRPVGFPACEINIDDFGFDCLLGSIPRALRFKSVR